MLNKNLLVLRKNKGVTQSQIAEHLAISRQAYNNYEKGIREPDYETLKRIAEYFNISTDYLLGLDENEQKKIRSSEDERILKLLQENGDVGKLVEKISQLSPENQQHLLRLVLLEADHIDNQYGK